ncbi:hypothetical protein KIPB_013186, partial [Kipferlia bialata]|eukprot:g13186.t1
MPPSALGERCDGTAFIVRDAYEEATIESPQDIMYDVVSVFPGTVLHMLSSPKKTQLIPLHLDETGAGVHYPPRVTQVPFQAYGVWEGADLVCVEWKEEDLYHQEEGKGEPTDTDTSTSQEQWEATDTSTSEGESNTDCPKGRRCRIVPSLAGEPYPGPPRPRREAMLFYRDYDTPTRILLGPYLVCTRKPRDVHTESGTHCLYSQDRRLPDYGKQEWREWCTVGKSSTSGELRPCCISSHTSLVLWDVDTLYLGSGGQYSGARYTGKVSIPPGIMLEMLGYLEQTASQLNTCPSHVAFRLCRALSSLSLADVARVVVNGRLSGLERVAGLCGLGDQLDAEDIEVVESIMGEEDESQEGIV